MTAKTTTKMTVHETPQADVLTFVVPPDGDGLRLDLVLARLMPDHSRARIRQWIDAGGASLIGASPIGTSSGTPHPKRALTYKTKVCAGDTIALTVASPSEASSVNAPQDAPLTIVDETQGYLILNKPAGVTVHPGAGNPDKTLLNTLLFHRPELAALPRAGIVHRLDKDTSGLMVVAKTETAHTALVRQLADRTVTREYMALVWGNVARDAVIEAPIGRHPKDRVKMAVVSRGKPAKTHIFVKERFHGVTLLLCRLETGRTHQIRVHCAATGHPLVGDAVYGGGAAKALGGKTIDANTLNVLKAFHRQALHAARLALIDPDTGEPRAWDAPLPDDFLGLLEKLA